MQPLCSRWEWREDVGRIKSLELTESRNDAKAKGGLKIQK